MGCSAESAPVFFGDLAMPSLNIDLDFWRHPKTVKLIAAAGEPAVCALLRLWTHCAKYHAESGKMWGYSVEDIEYAAEWHGARGELVAALERVGLLDKERKGYAIHDWLEHEGHIGLYRHRAKTAAWARWGKRAASRKPSPPQPLIPDASSNAKKETSNASALHCTALPCSDPEGGAGGSPSPEPPPAGPAADVPTLADCQRYAQDPHCAFPPEMVREWFDRQQDRGWGNDWRARMRSAVPTYREMLHKRKTFKRQTGLNPTKDKPAAKPKPPVQEKPLTPAQRKARDDAWAAGAQHLKAFQVDKRLVIETPPEGRRQPEEQQ